MLDAAQDAKTDKVGVKPGMTEGKAHLLPDSGVCWALISDDHNFHVPY